MGRRLALTFGTLLAILLFLRVSGLGPRFAEAPDLAEAMAAVPVPEALNFRATAYCKGTTTASGVPVRAGIAAADPALLPVGSIIEALSLGAPYDGIYTVMDTGPAVRGRMLDLYIWSCHEALKFGRRNLFVNILRLGWSPQASAPDLITSLFRKREYALLRRRDASPPSPPAAVQIPTPQPW